MVGLDSGHLDELNTVHPDIEMPGTSPGMTGYRRLFSFIYFMPVRFSSRASM